MTKHVEFTGLLPEGGFSLSFLQSSKAHLSDKNSHHGFIYVFLQLEESKFGHETSPKHCLAKVVTLFALRCSGLIAGS